MLVEYQDYSLFLKFFDVFSNSAIEGIDPDDPLMIKLDGCLEKNRQVFYISDVILFDVLFVSKSVVTMFGIKPEKVNQGYFLTTTHPEDFRRHSLVRSKMVTIAQELYFKKSGSIIFSSNFRARNPEGSYFNALYQAYLFYSKVPYESIFLILVITNISGFSIIHKGFHFYTGTDLQMFRYPDDELLMSGNIFSHTEFSIIELIAEGLSSKEIAQKLFRSPYTINTHRTNIIRKSGKRSITEVINDLKAQGLL